MRKFRIAWKKKGGGSQGRDIRMERGEAQADVNCWQCTSLMSSQVFVVLKTEISKRVLQSPMMIMCHELRIIVGPLLCA